MQIPIFSYANASVWRIQLIIKEDHQTYKYMGTKSSFHSGLSMHADLHAVVFYSKPHQ